MKLNKSVQIRSKYSVTHLKVVLSTPIIRSIPVSSRHVFNINISEDIYFHVHVIYLLYTFRNNGSLSQFLSNCSGNKLFNCANNKTTAKRIYRLVSLLLTKRIVCYIDVYHNKLLWGNNCFAALNNF